MWADARLLRRKGHRMGPYSSPRETQQETVERESDIEVVADRHLGRLSVRRTGWHKAERSHRRR